MSWKKIVKEFDEHGRDFDEQGLDWEGKPIPKKDDFLEEMKRLLLKYEKTHKTDGVNKRQMRLIGAMLEECRDELEDRHHNQR